MIKEQKEQYPPSLALRFFRWYCHPKLVDHIEGDLLEVYQRRVKTIGKLKADLKFVVDVLLLFRKGIIKPAEGHKNLNAYGMYKSYFKIGWRALMRDKGHSFVNIGGRALGMAVAMLIGLWVYDEISFDKYHLNYERIARVMQNVTSNGEVISLKAMPIPAAVELRNNYGDDFKHVVLSSWTNPHVLSFGEKSIIAEGNFMEAAAANMLTLKMKLGLTGNLEDPTSIVISETVAKSIFGDNNALDKILKLDDNNLKVIGVYNDLPFNSTFKNVQFIAPWSLYSKSEEIANGMTNWGQNSFQIFVQISDHANMDLVSEKIKDIKLNNISSEEGQTSRPEIFLFPMDRWHLFSEFKDGKSIGGCIQYVRLLGTVAILILVLACINFINLSTARSEKRAKEVGLRKAMGSARIQLIGQFFSESFIVVLIAFLLSLFLTVLFLPHFNELTNKKIIVMGSSPLLWALGIGFAIVTGMMAGIYPAIYLSSFQPVKILKGVFQAGKFSTLPRKVLVIFQFTVSVALVSATIIILQQIRFAQDRGIGYNNARLIMVRSYSEAHHKHIEALRNELLARNVISEMAESGNQIIKGSRSSGDFEWPGKDPTLAYEFATFAVSDYFGKTIGWQLREGRDFSNLFSTDSTSIILDATAVKYMGLKKPIGESIKWGGHDFKVIGVINDMIVESPYEPVKPTVYYYTPGSGFLNIRISQSADISYAIEQIKDAFKKYSPEDPFDYRFVDDEYERKFFQEKSVGKITSLFAVFAIVISCLGLYALTSFVAEQRTKEIGIRKVLGASAITLWQMLSKDFVALVIISCLIAGPAAYYLMSNWLRNYSYHIEASWWIFVLSGISALVIALLTTSYQLIKAVRANPVASLKNE